MQALIDKGADPNARVGRKVWYQAYNSDYAGFDEVGRDAVLPRRLRQRRRGHEAARRRTAPTRTLGTMKPAGRPFTGEGTRQIQDTSGVPPIPYGGPAHPADSRRDRRRLR